MKLKMLSAMGGTSVSVGAGDAYECDDAEAKRLIDAGHAVPWDDKGKERAVKPGANETR